jgi:putative ABC transport system substrate-binding protein
MRRRDAITLLGGAAAAWPLAAHAQQPDHLRRMGLLITTDEGDPEGQARAAAVRQGLVSLGWTENRNILIDTRWVPDLERVQTYVAELVGLAPDVIVANTSAVVAALQRATRTIPIVFAQVADPVGQGFVASLARPGGNVTGFATTESAISLKWLELLKEIAPSVTRVAVIYDPANPNWAGYLRVIEAAARSLAVQSNSVAVHNADEIQGAIEAVARDPNGGLIVVSSPLMAGHRELIISLAARHRVPAVYQFRFFVTSGGLASYGIDNIDLFRRAAGYVDRILKGEKPADLPVQNPTRYELVINLKTAKALGLDVPPMLLARTDEVIE